MKILFFYQHFWPDSPPYANMLRVIGRHLEEHAHQVTVLTGQPSYKSSDRLSRVSNQEIIDGISVIRLRSIPGDRKKKPLRLLGKALWPVRALSFLVCRSLRGNRQDVIVAATIPPVLNGLCALVAARLSGAKFVYHLQDIYPEIGNAGGLWSETSFRYRLLLRLDRFICAQADRCIVLSTDMAHTLAKRNVKSDKVRTINNFMLTSFDTPSNDINDHEAQLPARYNGVVRLVFAGNLGRFQGLENLLRGFLQMADQTTRIELHFLGEGAAMESLISLAHGHENVLFHGQKPVAQASRFISECDCGIVSIQPNVYRFAYPSKTLTYLGQGLPVLAIVEPTSSLAQVVQAYDLGVSVENTNPASLQKAIQALLCFLSSEANNRSRIKQATDALYSEAVALRQWDDLMAELNNARHISEKLP